MYVRNVYQFILENYHVSETEAIAVWKKSHWHGLLHPLALLVLIGSFLARFWAFAGVSDFLILGFISAKDASLAAIILFYIFLWNFLRIKFIKNYLQDKKR